MERREVRMSINKLRASDVCWFGGVWSEQERWGNSADAAVADYMVLYLWGQSCQEKSGDED